MNKLIKDIKAASYVLIVLKMLRLIVKKAKSKQPPKLGDISYSFDKCQEADRMVSVIYSEEMRRDASAKRKEACERMAAAITATQLKMPGGSEEMRAVLGGGANIQFASSEVFIGTPSNSHRLAMRNASAVKMEQDAYELSESGGSDIDLS